MDQKIPKFFKYAPGHYLYREKYDLMYYPERNGWEACENGNLVTAARTRQALCNLLDEIAADECEEGALAPA